MKVGDLVQVLLRGEAYIHVITKTEKRRNVYGTHDKYARVYGTFSWWPEHEVVILSESG